MSKMIGQHIITDPGICHGTPTFRGTRIMLWQVLEMVRSEMSWDEIVKQCHNSISKEAIAEAIGFAKLALYQQSQEQTLEPTRVIISTETFDSPILKIPSSSSPKSSSTD